MLAEGNVHRVDSMITIDMRHGLPESRVRGLYRLSDGRLAVLTAGYLSFFDGVGFKSVAVEPENGFPIEPIGKNRTVFQDKDGRLWLKTPSTRNDEKSRVNVFDVKTGEDMTMEVVSRFGSLKIRGLYGDEQGGVWIIDDENTLYNVHKDRHRKIISLDSFGKDIPLRLSLHKGKIYLLYSDGKVCVVHQDSGTVEFVASPPIAAEGWRLINSGIRWHDGKLWLSFYVPGNNDEGLMAVLDTADGSWILRYFKEIINDFIIEKDDSIVYGFKGLERDVSCILPDKDDGVWFGTFNNGLRFMNPRRLRLVEYCDSSCRLPKTGYYPTERCHENGLKYANGSVNSSVEDTVTGFVYLASRKGLFVIDGNDRLLGIIDDRYGLPHSNLQSVIAGVPRYDVGSDSVGDVWFATATGLSRLRYLPEKRFEVVNIGILDGLDLDGKEFISQSMTLDSCGFIKVAYPGGCCSLDPKDVCDVDYVTYGFPSGFEGKKLKSSDASGLSSFWWILVTMSILLLFCGVIFYHKSKRKDRLEKETPQKECIDENVMYLGGSASVEVCSDNLMDKVKEETSVTSEGNLSSQENDFRNRLNSIIFDHLDDETLNVASLSAMMAMDRTNLYRKMQNVFGLSPSVYIRNVRLEAACRLLKETDVPISEVAMRTGFSSAKYFSSTFKEKYGVLPSKYRTGLRQ